MTPYRTHLSSDLTEQKQGEEVLLAGWVHRKRDHGGLVFLDLRDHGGLVQCVLTPEEGEIFTQVSQCPLETVVQIKGRVSLRDKATQNPHLPSGMIEIKMASFRTISPLLEALPFPVSGAYDYTEELRLKDRFLDLRRAEVKERILKRSAFLRLLREGVYGEEFTEVHTPILTSSSPEGARDFLVPSRHHPGSFYALPQAPQIFKQMLMVGGIHRYFQIAPCFRDEDARADRTPGEFYQLDMEMSFTTQQEVMEVSKKILEPAFEQNKPDDWTMASSWITMSYQEAMATYGSDRPDLRNPLKICDVSDLFQKPEVELRLFREILDKGGIAKGIPAPDAGKQPRAFFDDMNTWARAEGSGGLGYIIFEKDAPPKGPLARFLPPPVLALMQKRANLKPGDALFFACDQAKKALDLAGKARLKIGSHLGCCAQKTFQFCWITHIPLYEKDSQTGNMIFSHNPFSMPCGGMTAFEQDPASILAEQYDLVCNGIEISSGAIRAYDPAILLRSFSLAGYDEEQVNTAFPALLRALRMGAPPHGGIAHGIERMLMLLCLQDNVREVIAFPMNQQGQDVMMGAPGKPLEGHLKELNICLIDKP